MISRKILPILIFTLALIWSFQLRAERLSHEFINYYSAQIYQELVEFRRDLYNHPEVSDEELRTSHKVAQYLLNLGLEVKTNIGGYGVVGILKGGKEGRRVVWRADMDAARYVYSSKQSNNDVKHICGHDVHTTIGLGIANVLSQKPEDLAGTIYFLFQPSEENQRGAKAMIDDGLYSMIEPDEIYGLHVAPMETGLVSTKSGNVFAHARRISVSFDGTDDSAKITRLVNEIVNGLTRVKDKLKFYDIYNIIDPGIGIGSPNTIYENYVAFYGAPTSEIHGNELKFGTEVYVTDRQDLDRVVKQLKQKIEETGYKDKLRSINYVDEREGVNNDVNLVESSITTLRNLFGEHIVSENYGQMPLASEDFGHFQRKIPGVYFFLGASNQTLGISAFPHMPNFSVDETSIQIGVRYFSSLLFERVSNKYHDSEFLDEGLKNTE